MKEYWNDDNFNRHKRREKPKCRALHGSTNLFSVLCCCLTVMTLAIGLITNDFPFAIDKQPNAHLSTSAVTNTDFNTVQPLMRKAMPMKQLQSLMCKAIPMKQYGVSF
jgi:hypothetical protein